MEAVDCAWHDANAYALMVLNVASAIRAAVAEERARTLALLRGLEWCDVDGGTECPRCYSTERQGHSEACELAAKIREC